MRSTFYEVFLEQVARNREKLAITDPDAGRQVSYQGLDDYAARIATKMRSAGVGRGDNVALILPNGMDQAAAMLAAMKLRAAFAPLNGFYPKDRLAYICKDCLAKLAITPELPSRITWMDGN